MSTRAVIARKTGKGFEGVYHHWDGYPEGLGATLFEVRNKYYGGNTRRMLEFLIDAHPGGWSTINKDWSLRPQAADHEVITDSICKTCGKPEWAHYRQYYKAGSSAELSQWERAGRPEPPAGDNVLVFGHAPETDKPEIGPEYHAGNNGRVTQADASGCGCEWAYVFDGNGKMEIQASICGPGKFEGAKMIGAFGCGDDKATWKTVATVNLDAPAPEWGKITA